MHILYIWVQSFAFNYFLLIFQIYTVQWNYSNLKDEINCSHNGGEGAYQLQSVAIHFNQTVEGKYFYPKELPCDGFLTIESVGIQLKPFNCNTVDRKLWIIAKDSEIPNHLRLMCSVLNCTVYLQITIWLISKKMSRFPLVVFLKSHFYGEGIAGHIYAYLDNWKSRADIISPKQ